MKQNRFTETAAVIFAVVLVIAGVIWNNVGTYTDKRAKVLQEMAAGSELDTALVNRGSDGLNLCVVARRHLPALDADILALNEASRTLQDQSLDAAKRLETSGRVLELAEALQEKLQECDGVAGSRDQGYLDMILNALRVTDDPITAAGAYNHAAQRFNEALASPVDGFLPRLFGVKPCSLVQ